MSELEDLLEGGLESVCEAFLTVIVTGNCVREWQWYARDPEKVIDLVNKTLGHLEPFPVDFSFQDDPEWEGLLPISRDYRFPGMKARRTTC